MKWNCQNKNDMKKTLIQAVLLTAIALVSVNASAHNRCHEDWKKKMQAEKIAFLTAETGITPEEAQSFWPVYNQVEKEIDEATRNVFRAYRELEKAIDENKPAKEIESLLNTYLDALKKQRSLNSETAEKYRKVLPVEKVAKVFVAEERFRRHHIRKLHGRPEAGPPKDQANR